MHFPKEQVRIMENLYTPAFPKEKDLKILQHTRKELQIKFYWQMVFRICAE